METLTGLLLGSLVRLLALALDIASSVIAMTASLSQIVGVPNEFAPHPIGNLLHLAGIALLLALGFPMLVADLLRESFALKPVGSWPQVAQLAPAAIALIGRSFVLALILSAPFILGGFLFQALSGVISKVMPALPIVFIGAPAAILLALIGLALLAPPILAVWADAVLSISLPGS
ncbi:flagellar biosynthetic protein FliR [Paracoccus sp. DMF-8]|uniref:flagellar biosynthetic protein FliR n=1 Tax=Paracoccus sp. DMF-8 TaxID=3019445 RepID=UPI0023E3F491|nr:flagellar biosynthetic protein FliR [Paracoccus sp. DMF-8]MDF3607269.1 flagellar biosynthetic protein FliR [Paracoccus sp. DMF-8]